VPDKPALTALAERLNDLGEQHAGVHDASIGSILPALHDPGAKSASTPPNGHADLPHGQAIRIENPREAAAQRQQRAHAQAGPR
jgi:hypothetical protein